MEGKNFQKMPNCLRKYRRAMGLKQKEVAQILGLKSASVVSRWEKGSCFPHAINILKLAMLYRRLVEELFIDSRKIIKDYLLKREEMVLKNTQEEQASPIDISIDKNILKIEIDKKDYPESIRRFKPRNKQELLALDLAKALNDLKALPLYLSYCKKYPDHLLRKVLGEVMEIPHSKIKKTRGALFNYLIQKYDKKDSKDSSN